MKLSHSSMRIREISGTGDLVSLTALIHSAYAPHATSGLRYWATHQSVEDTAKRFANDVGLVAVVNGEIVATITLRDLAPEKRPPC